MLLGKAGYAATTQEGLTFNSGLFWARTNSEKEAFKVDSALEELDGVMHQI
ncbi:MAG: hypothetical protein ACRCXC_00560 [Legionella sp.]